MVEAVAEYRKINRGISRTVILRCKVCSKSFGITTTAPGIYTPDVRQSWVCLGCGAKIKKGGVKCQHLGLQLRVGAGGIAGVSLRREKHTTFRSIIGAVCCTRSAVSVLG